MRFTLSATDPDGDQLEFSAQNLPRGASLVDRIFTWRPGFDQSGSYRVTFKVSDGRGGEDAETITITVIDVNRPPKISPIGDKSVDEGQTISFTVSASDPDGDQVKLTAEGLPEGASFSKGRFTWKPKSDQVGLHSVTFKASDGKGGTHSITVRIKVRDISPPTIEHTPPGPVGLGSKVKITAKAEDFSGVKSVKLRFKAGGEESFREIEMKKEG